MVEPINMINASHRTGEYAAAQQEFVHVGGPEEEEEKKVDPEEEKKSDSSDEDQIWNPDYSGGLLRRIYRVKKEDGIRNKKQM